MPEWLKALKQRCADLHLERQRINTEIVAAEVAYHEAKDRWLSEQNLPNRS